MTTKRRYFVAVNQYRSSMSDGFGNTWEVQECVDQKHQRSILASGLPVRDAEYIDNDGCRTPVISTMGVRTATQSEIRTAKREEDVCQISIIEHGIEGLDDAYRDLIYQGSDLLRIINPISNTKD